MEWKRIMPVIILNGTWKNKHQKTRARNELEKFLIAIFLSLCIMIYVADMAQLVEQRIRNA